MAYADKKLKAYVDGQVMDFSVRQLDSSQRKVVFSKTYSPALFSDSYTCEADGMYEVNLNLRQSDDDYPNAWRLPTIACNYNGQCVMSGQAKFESNMFRVTLSDKFYCNSDDVFSLYNGSGASYGCTTSTVTIYFTPYK